MDDVSLAAAKFATQEKGVIDDKVTINRLLPEPVHPEDSRNEGLRRRHEEVEDSAKIVLMDRRSISTSEIRPQWSRHSFEIQLG